MSHKHLSQTEPYQIYALAKKGHLPIKNANLLGQNKSSISEKPNPKVKKPQATS